METNRDGSRRNVDSCCHLQGFITFLQCDLTVCFSDTKDFVSADCYFKRCRIPKTSFR